MEDCNPYFPEANSWLWPSEVHRLIGLKLLWPLLVLMGSCQREQSVTHCWNGKNIIAHQRGSNQKHQTVFSGLVGCSSNFMVDTKIGSFLSNFIFYNRSLSGIIYLPLVTSSAWHTVHEHLRNTPGSYLLSLLLSAPWVNATLVANSWTPLRGWPRRVCRVRTHGKSCWPWLLPLWLNRGLPK